MDVKIAKKLIKYGAKYSERNADGRTPILGFDNICHTTKDKVKINNFVNKIIFKMPVSDKCIKNLKLNQGEYEPRNIYGMLLHCSNTNNLSTLCIPSNSIVPI